ncbi:hypothetical protein [Bizionia psychrotolerans]|uniref:hypothetical protein n=1 Tax=Bizionia psychrotolerans TaxID=1492901 RepID=UPI00065201B5|nr:hypothetical protein [Bizionia psychrotolerans]
MALIITSGDTFFELNNIKHPRIYQPLKQGDVEIGMYNIYDTKGQLKNSTHFNQYNIDGVVYPTQADTIEALLNVIYDSRIELGFSEGQINSWNNAYYNSITDIEVSGDEEKTITLTQQDGGTLQANFTDLTVDGIDENDFTTGATFSNGVLEFTSLSGNTYDVNLDGRYSLTGHTHSVSDLDGISDIYGELDFIDGKIDSHIADSSIHFTEASISITESQISDLSHFTPTSLMVDYGFTDNSTNWNTAYGWGNHATQGYITSGDNVSELVNDAGYITGYTETGNTDDYVDEMSFSTTDGILKLTRLSGDTLTEGLDGRYSLLGHSHTVSDITDFPTNVSDFTNDVNYTTRSETGSQLSANPSGSTISLLDEDGNILDTLNVGFLNNEGTTLEYSASTQTIVMRNDAGEILSSIPVSAFLTNIGNNLNLTGSSLQLRDSSNVVLSTVSLVYLILVVYNQH